MEHKNGFEGGGVHPIGGLSGKESGHFLRAPLLLQPFGIRKQTEQPRLLPQLVVDKGGQGGVVQNVIGQEAEKLPHRHRSRFSAGVILRVQQTEEGGIQADAAVRSSDHGRKLFRGAGPAQGRAVARHGGYAAVRFKLPDQIADPRLIPILVYQNDGASLREDVGHGVVPDQGIGDPGLGLQEIEADEKHDEERSDHIAQFEAEPRRPAHG